MNRIINLRGNSGSGKSTVAHEIMKLYKAYPLDVDGKGRPNNYQVDIGRKRLFIIGRYETQCGGCDQVGSSAEVMRRVEAYEDSGHVLFEGLLLSTTYGALGEWSQKWGHRMIYACLDTPLDLCLKRVQKRRETAGNTKPFNPANTIARQRAVESSMRKIDFMGHTVHHVDHRHATTHVLALLGVKR